MKKDKFRVITDDGFKVYCAYDELVPVNNLIPNERNPNKHPDIQIEMLAKIISENGWRAPITISRRSGKIVRGHARREAAILAGSEYVPVEWQDYDSDSAEMADLIADNRIAELANLDERAIAELLSEIKASEDIDVEMTGYTEEHINDIIEKMISEKDSMDLEIYHQSLSEQFLVPPFTVFDARGGVWANRKKMWNNLGINSVVGRGFDDDATKDGLVFSKSNQPSSAYKKKNEYEAKVGQEITWEQFATLFPSEMKQGGTSIFDPVLCEVAYRWFSPLNAKIIDPFAGGSVRGIVASLTGREYTGVDLSERQITANYDNWEAIDHQPIIEQVNVIPPKWIVGDSLEIKNLAAGEYDMFFTCPPYADLEVYSDNPKDLSNKEYPEFLKLYRTIISETTSMLKEDSFAVIVVGDIRDKQGIYRNFVSDTIQAFIDSGMKYYNEAVLITPLGSLPIRVGKQFKVSRKLGKTHQNVLVFVKGDINAAVKKLGDVEIPDEIDEQINDEYMEEFE